MSIFCRETQFDICWTLLTLIYIRYLYYSFRYKPELICWRNKLVETIDFADASTTDQYNRTNSVNANGENNPNSVFTLENLIKSIQNVGSLELESLSSIEYITHLICSSSIDEEVQAEVLENIYLICLKT